MIGLAYERSLDELEALKTCGFMELWDELNIWEWINRTKSMINKTFSVYLKQENFNCENICN